MKHQALLTIQAKLKPTNLAIILFYFSVAIDLQACGKRSYETMKSWSSAISKHIQLVFCCVMEKLSIFNICETYSGVTWNPCKKSWRTQLGQWYKAALTPKFDTVFLLLNWSSLRRKYWHPSKIPTDMNALRCGPKASTIWFREFRTPFPHATSAKILAACTRVCRTGWRNLF